MNLLQRIFGKQKKVLNNPDVMQHSFLLGEMQNIQDSCEERGSCCYELYTLMCTIAIRHKTHYGIDIHCKLINVAKKNITETTN